MGERYLAERRVVRSQELLREGSDKVYHGHFMRNLVTTCERAGLE